MVEAGTARSSQPAKASILVAGAKKRVIFAFDTVWCCSWLCAGCDDCDSRPWFGVSSTYCCVVGMRQLMLTVRQEAVLLVDRPQRLVVRTFVGVRQPEVALSAHEVWRWSMLR